MNNSFDFNSKKYMILLLLICIVFAILIIKAFDYLPNNDVIDSNDSEVAYLNVNSKKSSNTEASKNNLEVETKIKKNQKSGVLYRSSDSLSNDDNFDEIEAPAGVSEESINDENNNTTMSNQELSGDFKAVQYILNGRKYVSENNLSKALIEYGHAVENAKEDEIKAQALEGISIVYAKNKKYSTALTFASKANGISPSVLREFLIIKIYYLAGKSDIAIKNLNEILKKGF